MSAIRVYKSSSARVSTCSPSPAGRSAQLAAVAVLIAGAAGAAGNRGHRPQRLLRGPGPAHRARFEGRALHEPPGQEPDLPFAPARRRHHGPRDERRALPQPDVLAGAFPHHGFLPDRGCAPRHGRHHRPEAAAGSLRFHRPPRAHGLGIQPPPQSRHRRPARDLRPTQRHLGRRPRGHRDGQGEPRRGARDRPLRPRRRAP